MSVDSDSAHSGHRERLREKFSRFPQELTDLEYIELLLTYAIPRMDVRPVAMEMLESFGDLASVLSASAEELKQVKGIGESAIVFLRLIHVISTKLSDKMPDPDQPMLFPVEKKLSVKKTRAMRVFANDEIENSLQFLPRAWSCSSLAEFKNLLAQELPYNSVETRQRRSSYIIDRFYPGGYLNTPLTLFTQHCKAGDALKPVVFYHIAKAEPLLAKTASEFIFPALPMGKIGREQLREFIQGCLPGISESSQKNALRSIFYAYGLLNVGRDDGEYLKFQLRQGNLDSFIYILSCEFPEPGIYSFDNLFEGPAYRWLLWDKEWIRKQLYALRDMNIVSKVSEIDTVRQFSLEFGQQECLARYFKAVGLLAIMDKMGRDTDL